MRLKTVGTLWCMVIICNEVLTGHDGAKSVTTVAVEHDGQRERRLCEAGVFLHLTLIGVCLHVGSADRFLRERRTVCGTYTGACLTPGSVLALYTLALIGQHWNTNIIQLEARKIHIYQYKLEIQLDLITINRILNIEYVCSFIIVIKSIEK